MSWPAHIQTAAAEACREYLEGGEDGYPLAHIMAREMLAAEQRGAEREREKWVNWLRDANSEPPIAALVD